MKAPLHARAERLQAVTPEPPESDEINISDVESIVIADHRKHIEDTMRLVRLEMQILSQVKPESCRLYAAEHPDKASICL